MNGIGQYFHGGPAHAATLSAGQVVVVLAGEDPASSAEEHIRMIQAVAADRDRAAFSALFDYFAPRVKAFMVRSGMTSGVAEELAQETMLIVWRKASYFDPARAGVSTWIFTIARNLRIDRLRRDRRPDRVAAAFDPSDEPDRPLSSESAMIAAERDARVREALAILPDQQALIVRLSFFSEKPQAEIARELGIPIGTVKSRVRLAMNRLRSVLDDLT